MFDLSKSNKVQSYRSDLLHGKISDVTKENILTLLDDEDKSFQYLHQAAISRSFPDSSHLTPSAANVLREVLQNGSIPRTLEDEGVEACYKMGWLHSEMLEVGMGEVVCVFPTRLHAK